MRCLAARAMVCSFRGPVLGRLALVVFFVAAAWEARGDIYQRTLGPSGWKAQSSTLCPGGSGVSAVPGTDLESLDLMQAYLINATLTNANLSGADTRGAAGFSGSSSGAITTDTILPDGTIEVLTLDSTSPTLFVRNYSGAASIPIHVRQYMTLTQRASLEFERCQEPLLRFIGCLGTAFCQNNGLLTPFPTRSLAQSHAASCFP